MRIQTHVPVNDTRGLDWGESCCKGERDGRVRDGSVRDGSVRDCGTS